MKVVVGTTNSSKLLAVKKAWTLMGDAEIIGVSVSSDVPEQPMGMYEILEGALNRALSAYDIMGGDYSVGIEAGYIPLNSLLLDVQVVIILDRDNRVTVGFSPAFQVPQEALRYQSLGDYMAYLTGRKNINREIGAIGYFTKGAVTRTDLTYNAVIMALVPRLNSEYYGEPLSVEELRRIIAKKPI